MTPAEKLHNHHDMLMSTIHNLAERTISDSTEASLLISFCSEYLISHAEAEEVTFYRVDTKANLVEEMIREHREITDTLEAIGNSYAKGDSAGIVCETKKFISILNKHFSKEENILMPKLTKKLTQQELESLIEQARQIEAEKKKSDLWSLFEHDHKRIDFDLSRLRKSVAGSDIANGFYSKIRAQLLKHVELEEIILFPIYDEHTGLGETGLVQVLIAEHHEITSLLVKAGDTLNDKSFPSSIDELIGKLAVHNKKEEMILYPLINRSLSASQRVKVFKECSDGMAMV